jgi:hypothetical protein
VPPVAALADLGVSDLLAALDTCPALVAITIGPDHVLAFQNIESARLTGRRTLGQPFAVAFPEATADNMAALDRVLSTREPYEQSRRPLSCSARRPASCTCTSRTHRWGRVRTVRPSASC